MNLLHSLRALGTAAGAAAVFAVGALPAQAAPAPLFSFAGQTANDLPTIGTIETGSPLIESTSAADNLSGVQGFSIASSNRQLLLDTGLGEDQFGAFVTTSWSYQFTADGTQTFSFGYNFLSNVTPGSGTEFFTVDLDNLLFGGLTSLVSLSDADLTLVGGGPLAAQTGWQRVNFTPLAGSYSLLFTLATTNLGCATGVDCIPTLAVISDIPEPASLALVTLALGGALLPAVTRRRREPAVALAA